MGSAPDTVNYRGEVLTDQMQEYLFGKQDILGKRSGGLPADRAQEILTNWLFGIQPKAIDPTEAIGRADKISGQSDRAAMGEGVGGLFGFGKSVGSVGGGELTGIEDLGNSPMAPGVPYKVPPLPKVPKGAVTP